MDEKSKDLRTMLTDLVVKHNEETMKALDQTDDAQERLDLLRDAVYILGFSSQRLDP